MGQNFDHFDTTKGSKDKILDYLGILTQHGNLQPIQQLAILTRMRHEVSNQHSIDNSDLLELTNSQLITVILQILQAPDSADLKYMKLEAAWILTNMAYGEQDVLTAILTPQVLDMIN